MPFAGTGGQSGRTQQGSLQRQHAQRLHLHCSVGGDHRLRAGATGEPHHDALGDFSGPVALVVRFGLLGLGFGGHGLRDFLWP